MNAISAFILVVLIGVLLFASRRWAILGLAAGTLYLTEAQSVQVFGINLFAMRFLEIAGLIRVIARREFCFSRLNDIDRFFLLFYSYLMIVSLLRSNNGQAYLIGLFVDATFCYFIFRGLAEDIDDIRWFLRALVFLLVPYVALLLIETVTHRNPFDMLGRSASSVWIRGNRIRCFGSFREPSLLGTLGASFLPIYIGLCFSKANRLYATIGIIACTAIVLFSNSGSPLAFSGIGVVGWALWVFRDRMRLMRRVAFVSLAALALVMKAPLWYLPTKIKFLTGGDAWHRSYLMDVAMRHFGQWWLWGMSTSKTRDWFPYFLATTGAADITNQYVSFGLTAGFMAIILFVWLLSRMFSNLGKKLAEVRLISPRPSETEYFLWGFGVMLVGHITNLLSISYFDQIYVIWFMQLAFISTLTHEHNYLPVH